VKPVARVEAVFEAQEKLFANQESTQVKRSFSQANQDRRQSYFYFDRDMDEWQNQNQYSVPDVRKDKQSNPDP
jgi:hypothetical protein